jgi:hypothetical protein
MKNTIEELEAYFQKELLPETLRLSGHENITNVKGFVKSHINYVKANISNKNNEPYLNRLQKVYNLLNQSNG